MAKHSTVYELMLPARDDTVSAYEWLYSAIRGKILAGQLHPGARLPATRDLARQFALSRGTIVNAFDQLKAEGYLEGTIGSGTYVSHVLPDSLLRVPAPKTSTTKSHPLRRPFSAYAKQVRHFSGLANRPARAFRTNLPALDLFPVDIWSQVATRRLRNISMSLLLGCEPMGYLPLREAVSNYLVTSRGVKCTPEQIAIVSGVQEALDLVARLFLSPRDRVCMEDPGYPGAAYAFEAMGAKLSLTASDKDGMQLRPAALRDVRMVYATPAHQFPTGVTMSLGRRLELIEWAHRTGAVVLEDDYDSEFRYSSRPVPAMQGLDPYGVVLFTGSFSKVLFPSLRLGYLVVPPDLVDRLSAAISTTSRHAPVVEQAILCDFISQGHFARHLRRMREIYAERLTVLIEAMRQRLRGVLEVSEIEAGLQTSAWLKEGLDGNAIREAARKRNVEVTPFADYSQRPLKRDGLQLGFAPIDEKEIRRGVADLAAAIETLL